MKTSFRKLTNWEYWPSSLFYIPNLPYALFLAIKAKSAGFFYAANPAIHKSGDGTESKYDTIMLVPEILRPKSVLVKPNTSFDTILENIDKKGIPFPLIVKPDNGFRGLLVQKLYTKEALKNYIEKYPLKLIIQEYLEYPNECGIFYHRMPNKKTGTISSITLKEFLTVTGDGKTTLEELILKNKRVAFYKNHIEKKHRDNFSKIIPNGKKIKLSVIGNHSKGTRFINGNHLISDKLTQVFDTLSLSINGWYYGRIDLKYNTFEQLEIGENFKIIEINGIIAEPTHIYDSNKGTYWQALQSIRKHWFFLLEISKTNNLNSTINYGNFKDLINSLKKIKKIRNNAISLSKK